MSAAVAAWPRTPAAVVLELGAARTALEALDRALAHRDPTDAEDRQWATLEDSIALLTAELRGMVRDRMSVSADALMEALS